MIDPNLRLQVMAIETETPSLKEKYKKEIEAMIEKELTSFKRMEMYAEIVIGISVLFGGLLIAGIYAKDNTFHMMCILILMSAFGLSGVIHGLWTLRRGKIIIKQERYIEMTILWGFGVLIFIFCVLNSAFSEDPFDGILKVLYGFPILFFLLLATLHRFIEKNGLEQKEHLLRLELLILELDKKINTTSSNSCKE